MRALSVLFGLLLPAAITAAAPPEKTVAWYQMDLPPAYLPREPDQPKDLQTVVDAAVRDALEAQGYSVLWRAVNMEQQARELRSNPRACNGAQLRTPQMEAFLEYSIPHSISLAPAAVVKRDRLEKFRPYLDAQGRFSLESAMAKEGLFAGVSAGREYSDPIDALLGRHARAPNVVRRNSMSNGRALLEMLLGGRIDYTILYPWEANFLAAELGKADQIHKLPVQGMDPYVVVVVGCSKGPWGKAVVQIANTAIAAIRDTPEYEHLKESWLDPDELMLHRKYRAEVFAESSPAAPAPSSPATRTRPH